MTGFPPTSGIPFQSIDWNSIEAIDHKGETGASSWKTIEFPGIRIRLVEYSKGYAADHWCRKGHIVHCLEGEFTTELGNGEGVDTKKGGSFVVSDNTGSHRIVSAGGCTLLIVDGDFLK